MNERICNKVIEISRALKTSKATGKSWHTSFAVYKNRIIAIGWNDYRLHHNSNKWGQYKNYKSLPGRYIPSRHGEIHLATRLGEDNWNDLQIYNCRIDNNGNVSNSMPCLNCLGVIKQLAPKRFYFTNNQGAFEQLAY